jgi:hypothetical protein
MKREMAKLVEAKTEAVPLLKYFAERAKAKIEPQEEQIHRAKKRMGELGEERTEGGAMKRRMNTEGNPEDPPSRSLSPNTTARKPRVHRTLYKIRTPNPNPGAIGGKTPNATDEEEEPSQEFERKDCLGIVDPKHFTVKLDREERSINYREWSINIKRFIKSRPGVGRAALRAME